MTDFPYRYALRNEKTTHLGTRSTVCDHAGRVSLIVPPLTGMEAGPAIYVGQGRLHVHGVREISGTSTMAPRPKRTTCSIARM